MGEPEDKPEDGEEKRRRAQRRRNLARTTSAQLGRVARILRFADLMALMMVAATAFAGYAAWRTAQIAELIFAVSARPYLGVEQVSFDTSKPDHPEIVVQFRNFGQIPASETIVGVRASLDGKLLHSPRDAVTAIKAGIVSPTVPHYFYAPIAAEAYRSAVNGSARLMVRIKMQYKGPQAGVDYCYSEELLYYHNAADFRLSGGTARCAGGEAY
jgi:hypothetical protein